MTRDISLTERVPSVRGVIHGVSSHDYVIPNLKQQDYNKVNFYFESWMNL